jgi:peptidyl-tRNA hydrolase, PTH2 family
MKQVIVIRKDLNMRKGKMVAQGAHASLNAFLTNDPNENNRWYVESRQTKICVSVDSEAELLEIYQKAQDACLPSALVKDAGLTEFKEPTFTAVAIGPADDDVIDLITKHLKLL